MTRRSVRARLFASGCFHADPVVRHEAFAPVELACRRDAASRNRIVRGGDLLAKVGVKLNLDEELGLYGAALLASELAAAKGN